MFTNIFIMIFFFVMRRGVKQSSNADECHQVTARKPNSGSSVGLWQRRLFDAAFCLSGFPEIKSFISAALQEQTLCYCCYYFGLFVFVFLQTGGANVTQSYVI